MVNNFVYDVTAYMLVHPGGKEILKEYVGTDATKEYNNYHSWVNA